MKMFYNPDDFDAVIVICKFLTVFSCGLLTGEALFLSRVPCNCLFAMLNVDKISMRVFRFAGTAANLHMYQLNLLTSVAGLAVFVLETRDRHYWLYGTLGMFLVFLYTKLYLGPRFINHLLEADLNKKNEVDGNSMTMKFQQRHHGRTAVSCITFVWFIYSLYVS